LGWWRSPIMASSILQFRHRAAARAVEAKALSSLQSIIDGKDVLQGSTTEPYPKVDELVRRILTGQPTVTSSGDTGGYWHVDFCFESGSHVYVGIWPGDPSWIADLYVHSRGEGRHPFEPCK
jgi:hypothetical protein